MTDLRDLYQEVILDHARQPRNFRRLEGACRHVTAHNPLCGDRFDLDVRVEGDVVTDACFEGEGCAISKASASLMTETVRGRSVADAAALGTRFRELLTGEGGRSAFEVEVPLGKLEVFSGVVEFPARVKCAALAWHALAAALDGHDEQVTTE